MKKLLSMLLAVCMVFALCACGSKAPTPPVVPAADANAADTPAEAPKETVVLHMWGGVPAENGYQACCDAFNQAFKDKGIQIEYERYVNDETGNVKLETNLMGGGDIDVFMTYGTSALTKRAKGNMALDLSELCQRDGMDLVDYLGTLVENYYVDGKPYSVPCNRYQYGLVLNKDMFDAAGIDIPTEWTFDEFLEVCKKLTKGEGADKVYGMFWNSQQDMAQYAEYLVCQTLGGDDFYADGGKSCNFDNEVWVKAVELIATTMHEGYAPSHEDSVTEKLSQESMFLTGKTAMTIGPWMVRNIKDTATYPHEFVTAFAPYPVMETGSRKYTQGGIGDYLCINPQSENIDAAWEFVKWYMEEGCMYLTAGGRIPAANTHDPNETVSQFLSGGEELFDAESAKEVLIVLRDNYAAPTITTKISELTDILNEELEAIYTRQKTPEEGLASAKARGDAILGQ